LILTCILSCYGLDCNIYVIGKSEYDFIVISSLFSQEVAALKEERNIKKGKIIYKSITRKNNFFPL